MLIGRVGAAHGLTGEVRIWSFLSAPEDIFRLGTLLGGDQKRPLRPHLVRKAKPGAFIGKFDGVTSRIQAESLKDLDLFIERNRLPALSEDEFYYHDLIGMSVRAPDGTVIGDVRDVLDYGAGPILQIRISGGQEILAPFNKRVATDVNLHERRLTVDLPEESEALQEPETKGKP